MTGGGQGTGGVVGHRRSYEGGGRAFGIVRAWEHVSEMVKQGDECLEFVGG